MDPARRLMSAACIIHCINLPSVNVLYMSHDPEKFLLPLARLLSLHPDIDAKAEYDQLCSKIFVEQRYGIVSIIHVIGILAVIIILFKNLGQLLLNPFLNCACVFLGEV